ncbi:hypothetical protein DFH09DRAFT_532055 [Mycena vulgaris]|nr:hypothetical protein DFH09DRAFT_532055 [Mycena vulgaris]
MVAAHWRVCRSCASTDASCRAPRRAIDRPSIRDSIHAHAQNLVPRSLMSETSITIVAAVVGVLAVCGILSIVLWYRQGNSAFASKKERGFAKLDDRAWDIAPLPRVYAERWATLVETTSSTAQLPAPAPAEGWPNLVITIAADTPPPVRTWKLKRVPVPRLSKLPSAGPRTPLAWLRTPRQRDVPPRSSSLKPMPPPPSPLSPTQRSERTSLDISSGVPSALSSPTPLTSRPTTIIAE